MKWTVTKPKMRSFRQSPGRKVPTPNSRGMVRFLGKVVQGHHYSLLTQRSWFLQEQEESRPRSRRAATLDSGGTVRPLLQSGSWLSPKGSCTEGWSPECCYCEMVGTFNTPLGKDFWWELWDSGLLPTCFYLVSMRWTILFHYTPPLWLCCLTMDPKGAGARDHQLKHLRQWAKIHLLSLELNCLEICLTAPPLSSGSLTITSLISILSGLQGSHISISTGIRTSQVPP